MAEETIFTFESIVTLWTEMTESEENRKLTVLQKIPIKYFSGLNELITSALVPLQNGGSKVVRATVH